MRGTGKATGAALNTITVGITIETATSTITTNTGITTTAETRDKRLQECERRAGSLVFASAVIPALAEGIVAGRDDLPHAATDPKRSSAHINALFISKVIWPVGTRKCMGSGCGAQAAASVPLADTFRTNIAAVLSQDGIAQVNHPKNRWSVKPEDLYEIPDYTLLEIWNGQGHINNLGGSDGAGDERPSAEGYWDILLSRGKIIWGVGSDDSHEFGEHADPHGAPPGQAWIAVHAPELTPKAIRAALHDGDFYASTGVELKDYKVEGKQITVSIKNDRAQTRFRVEFIGKNGQVLETTSTNPGTYTIKGDELYVRVRITDSNGLKAWTQPVFVHP